MSIPTKDIFELLLHTPVYDGADFVTRTTKGNKNCCVTFPISIVTGLLGDIVEWYDQDGPGVDTEHMI